MAAANSTTVATGDTKDSPPPPWIEKRMNYAIALAFVLITLYLTPLYMITYVGWQSDGFKDESFGFRWFVAFLKHSDATLGQFHKLLFPILVGLSVVMLKGRQTKAHAYLVIYILIGLVLAIYSGVYFDMSETLKAIALQPDKPPTPELVSSFFARIQEVLLIYLSLLLGLSVAK